VAYLCFIILPDACFSYDAPCDLAFDPTFACCRGVREFGPAPPKRRASEARCKTPEVNLRRPPLVNLSRPSLARLALGAGHRQTRKGPGLASGGLCSGLGKCGAANLDDRSFRARSEISSGKEASFKASNKGWVVCDHPGEVRPRIPVGENRVKLLFNRRCSFHRNPPFLLGKGILSD